jgi:hypothetical protein
MRLVFSISLLTCFIFSACSPSPKSTTDTVEKNNSGVDILNLAIAQHGGTRYDSAFYQFEFRGNTYTFHNQGDNYVYTKTTLNDTDTIVDVLSNTDFKRSINQIEVAVSDSEKTQYSEGINSVIYFATLPYKLNDPAVQSTYAGEQTIKGKNYDMIRVTFSAENGGADFEDAYQYWINKNNHTVDYLAYNYKVNGGGVRFRSAYNPRIIEGVYFQDYINFKAPVGTPLDSLALMYEQNTLEELSRIETEKVLSLH